MMCMTIILLLQMLYMAMAFCLLINRECFSLFFSGTNMSAEGLLFDSVRVIELTKWALQGQE